MPQILEFSNYSMIKHVLKATRTLSCILFLLFIAGSCKNSAYDGRYCAEVNYYNPNTGTRSEYTLTITVDNNILTRLDFPKGGLEGDDLPKAQFSSNGKTKFSLPKGYEYSVKITGAEDNCFVGVPRAVQCKGVTKKNKRCENLTDNANGLCWSHKNQ